MRHVVRAQITRAFLFSFLFVLLGVAPTLAAERALLRQGAVFPGGKVINLGSITTVNGQVDGISFTHNSKDAGGVISNVPDEKPERLSIANGWRVECNRDPMFDTTTCGILRHVNTSPLRSAPIVSLYTDGKIICVPSNNFPGKDALVRIDASKPETGVGKGGCLSTEASRRILAQMQAGSTVRVRAYIWPHESAQDVSFTTYGLPQAFKMMEWMAQNSQ